MLGYLASSSLFQSTLPLRGVTGLSQSELARKAISIHTPLAGSDEINSKINNLTGNFNPHSPCGE